MLDYLLIRPRDRKLWEKNKPTTLRYVVVDELHTSTVPKGQTWLYCFAVCVPACRRRRGIWCVPARLPRWVGVRTRNPYGTMLSRFSGARFRLIRW